MDQARDAVFHDEARADTLPVFPNPAGDVVGDADVERPVLAAGKDVNVIGNRPAPTPMGPGDKPRDTDGLYSRFVTGARDSTSGGEGKRVEGRFSYGGRVIIK